MLGYDSVIGVKSEVDVPPLNLGGDRVVRGGLHAAKIEMTRLCDGVLPRMAIV
jgi:hypothetical protein